MIKLLQKRRAKNVSIIKSEYPYLSDNEILEILQIIENTKIYYQQQKLL